MNSAPEIEEAILGAILIEKEAIIDVVDLLKEEHFYVPKHKLIYKHIIKLYSNSEPIDMLSVMQSLIKTNELQLINGVSGLNELTNKVASSANILYHARIVVEKFIARRLEVMGLELTQKAADTTRDPFELIAETEKILFEINGTNNIEFQKLNQIFFDFISQDKKNMQSTGGIVSICREPYFGSEQEDLIIIAGRPSMGKTAFALSNMIEQAKQGYPCAFYSLEMSKTQIMARIMSMLSGIDVAKIQRNTMNPYELQQVKTAYEEYRELPILISDKPALTLLDIKTSARRIANKGVKSIYIDQLNHINHSSKGRSRNDEVGEVSRSIKSLAKELKVPIHLLHQLSRGVESRSDKKPNMSDLRDSGNVEQDADKIWLIHREDYYNKGGEQNGMATIIIEKNRGGATGEIVLGFDGRRTMFYDGDFQHHVEKAKAFDIF